MLVSAKVIDAVNGQIGMEFAASLQYDAIGAHFDLHGPAPPVEVLLPAVDGRAGARPCFMRFVLDAGGQVAIPAIEAPVGRFQNSPRMP